jgi:hypothetical protein
VRLLGRLARDQGEGAAVADELVAAGVVAPQAEAAEGRDRLVEAARRLEVCDPDPEVVDHAGLTDVAVVHGLRAIAVRVEEERAVVVLAVLGPWPRLAVARVSRLGARVPEGVHVRA